MTAAPSTRTATTPATQAPRGWRGRARGFAEEHRSTSILIGMAIAGALLGILPKVPPLALIQSANPWYDAFANAGVFVLLAMGLNVVVGLAGLLDLGYAAFFAIGAYTYAYSNSPYAQQDLPFFPMLVVGAAVAAVFGIALGAPTLRLRGDYLAIMTLGFGEIVPIVFVNTDPFTGGTNGIGGIFRPEPLPILGEFSPLTAFNYMIVMVVIVTVAMMLLYRLHDSRIGRAWMAIREDELAAAANGINTVATKLLAFALGATTSGFAGVFNASKLTIVSPDQFSFTVSFTVLAMIIVGGMGNIWGVAAGAFIVFMIQAVVLKQLSAIAETLQRAGLLPPFDLGPLHVDIAKVNFVEYQYLLFGIALVIMMLKRPEGLFPSQVRRAELHEVNEELAAEDATSDATLSATESESGVSAPGSQP
ncbi:MAG TPA: branched-chain amino acid ABC transporter permease [Candidatus Limnocylindrales bacterium]|nr:branched-chain amino acid ABC transporter permease [Candidatus Limnocylindrales bacterium]